MSQFLYKIEHVLGPNLTTYDPYDLWKTKFGLWLKSCYYKYGKFTIPLVGPFFVLDTYAPRLIRLFIKPQEYPTVRAFAALSALNLYEITSDDKYLGLAADSVEWLINNQSPGYHGACWGLNFPWMTKAGYYPSTTPFITHTPYCVEALLRYSDITHDKKSLETALSVLNFMECDLAVLYQDAHTLALSYGPGYERRIVVNANSYAMMLYALFASKISDNLHLLERATRLFKYLVNQQNNDGSWYYYADNDKGNFIDCFHSCFILKNLVKYGKLTNIDVLSPVNKGLAYIINNFIDPKYYLARRFMLSANPSLTKFDLYDQAELLNVLIATQHTDIAVRLHDSIVKYFYLPSKGTFGYQIDIFGRLNEMEYLRWAVMPMTFVMTEYYKQFES